MLTRKFLLPYLVLIASQIPLCFVYFLTMMKERSHYALFPIAFIGSAFFIYRRWPKEDTPMFFPTLRSDLYLMFGVVLGVFATLWLSPWCAFASFLLLLGSLLARTNDGQVFGTLLPAIAPLIVLLQPPLAFDFDSVQGDLHLIRGINEVSTSLAGSVLDLSKFPHNITKSQMEFTFGMIDSATLCRGTLSVYTLLIITGLFIAWKRISMVRAVLLLVSAVFWFMFALTVILIVSSIAQVSFERDLYSPGRTSQTIQICGLIFAGIMTLLSERLVDLFCGPVDIQAVDENASHQDKLCRFWNTAIAGEVSPVIDANVKKEVAWAKRRASTPSTGTASFLWGASILMGVMCALQAVGISMAFAKSANNQVAKMDPADSLLPESIGAWSKVDYEKADLAVETPFDTTQQTWKYKSDNGLECTVRFNVPFIGWHDSDWHAKRNDWDSDFDPEEVQGDDFTYTIGNYYNSLAYHQVSYVLQLDGFGRSFERPSTWENLPRFVNRGFGRVPIRSHPRMISSRNLEIVVSLQHIGPILDTDRELVKELFLGVANLIQKRFQDAESERGS